MASSSEKIELAWLAQSMYDGQLPSKYQAIDLSDVCQSLSLTLTPHGAACCNDSAMVARYVSAGGTRYLVFGGTTAGNAVSDQLWERVKADSKLHLIQWVTNVFSAIGGVSSNLEQAKRLAESLDPDGLILVGHSKGAVEATYAALALGLPAVVFCSPGLSQRVLISLPQPGADQIHHFALVDDPVSALPQQLGWLSLPGTTHWMQGPADVSGVDQHQQFYRLLPDAKAV